MSACGGSASVLGCFALGPQDSQEPPLAAQPSWDSLGPPPWSTRREREVELRHHWRTFLGTHVFSPQWISVLLVSALAQPNSRANSRVGAGLAGSAASAHKAPKEMEDLIGLTKPWTVVWA